MCSETSLTGILFSVSKLAVPPVESISIFASARALANSTMPDLSETLIRALLTGQGLLLLMFVFLRLMSMSKAGDYSLKPVLKGGVVLSCRGSFSRDLYFI